MTSYHHGNLRTALVEAASELARTEGPDGVVLREVARRTGVSHNAAYRHFADRDELLAEVAAVGMARLEQTMNDRLAEVRQRDPRERAIARLRATGRAYVDFALAEPGLFGVAFAVPMGVPKGEGPYGVLLATLEELVEVGALSPQRKAACALTCWSAVHGFAMLHLRGPLRGLSSRERKVALDQLLDTLEAGLR